MWPKRRNAACAEDPKPQQEYEDLLKETLPDLRPLSKPAQPARRPAPSRPMLQDDKIRRATAPVPPVPDFGIIGLSRRVSNLDAPCGIRVAV